MPNASVVNYTNIAGLNLANTHILPTCQVCGKDFTVQADVSGTHLIGDVVGYFWKPSAFPTAGRAHTRVRRADGSPVLDSTRTKGFSAVTGPSTGVFCLATSVNLTTSPAIVTAEWGDSVGNDLLAFWQGQADGFGCPAGQLEVRTYDTFSAPALSNDVAFSVFIP